MTSIRHCISSLNTIVIYLVHKHSKAHTIHEVFYSSSTIFLVLLFMKTNASEYFAIISTFLRTYLNDLYFFIVLCYY